MPIADDTIATNDLRIYEFCFLYPSNLSQKEEATLLKDVENIIEEQGGKQVSKDLWGKRGIAYKIKGYMEGNYVVYHYEMDPSKLKEIDETLRITPHVLRHIVVKPPKGYAIVKYSEAFGQWLKDREVEVERKEREHEQKLAKKVAEKAQRQVKRSAAAQKKEATETVKPVADRKKISEELDKLISDDDLNL